MNQMVIWVEIVLSYDDDDDFFLLEDVSLVVRLYQVFRCKLLERMLRQTLEEEPIHFIHVVNVYLILLLVNLSFDEGRRRLHSCP